MNERVLEVRDLVKSFHQADQSLKIIAGASFFVDKGEFVALVGPSGSGKTTLLQMIGLLDDPDSGVIKIANQEFISRSDEARTMARRTLIGFVYQHHHLLPEFSALENVALPLLVNGVSRAKAINMAQEILAKVDLSNRANHNPSQLSGGQQQRVAIARAMITRPSLLLADEPTGNLDHEMSHKIFDLLKALIKSQNLACIMVTHNMELAGKADRVMTLRDGLVLDNFS
jgi:lipoprotein-releasing system ATP-binding protein